MPETLVEEPMPPGPDQPTVSVTNEGDADVSEPASADPTSVSQPGPENHDDSADVDTEGLQVSEISHR